MVTAEGDSVPAPGSDLLGRFVNGARSTEGRRFPAHALAGEVDRRSLFAEHESDALTSAAACPGHQGDLIVQVSHVREPTPRTRDRGAAGRVRRPPVLERRPLLGQYALGPVMPPAMFRPTHQVP